LFVEVDYEDQRTSPDKQVIDDQGNEYTLVENQNVSHLGAAARLLEHAMNRGVRGFVADILPRNAGMLRLIAREGCSGQITGRKRI
jgi:hypothetical protein